MRPLYLEIDTVRSFPGATTLPCDVNGLPHCDVMDETCHAPAYVSPFLYMSLSFYLLASSTPDPHRCVFRRFDTSSNRRRLR